KDAPDGQAVDRLLNETFHACCVHPLVLLLPTTPRRRLCPPEECRSQFLRFRRQPVRPNVWSNIITAVGHRQGDKSVESEMTGAQNDMRIDGFPPAASRMKRRREGRVRSVSPGPDRTPSGCVRCIIVAKPRSTTPRTSCGEFDEDAHLGVVLATGQAGAVRGRADLDEQDRRLGQWRDLQRTARVADVLEPVPRVQNGHAALRPSSMTFMTLKLASVKPPIVYQPRSP